MNELEIQVKRAVDGDKNSLEEVIKSIQDFIYNLAIRMLWHPDDAKDATQDILIKIVTNLSRFGFKSSFKTWVYRIASNEIINFKKKYFKQQVSFSEFENQLNHGLSDSIAYTTNKAEQNLLVQEAKVGCSNAMLQCLNRESRLTYIIGEILNFNSHEGAFILNLSQSAFRKRLSRGRKNLHQFMNDNCGIVNPNNKCKCHKKVDVSINRKVINPGHLLFAESQEQTLIKEIDMIEEEVALFQSNPDYQTPDQLLSEVKRIISATDRVAGCDEG